MLEYNEKNRMDFEETSNSIEQLNLLGIVEIEVDKYAFSCMDRQLVLF